MQSIVGLILLLPELVQHMHFINLRIKNLKFNRLDLWMLSEEDTLEAREIAYDPSMQEPRQLATLTTKLRGETGHAAAALEGCRTKIK